jgi:hypothetical protein
MSLPFASGGVLAALPLSWLWGNPIQVIRFAAPHADWLGGQRRVAGD